MRLALFILIGLVVFGGAYLTVAVLLPDPMTVGGDNRRSVTPVAPTKADGTLGDVEGVTLRPHDPQTGAAVAEVHVGRYTRKSDREIELVRVTATALAGSGVVTLDAPSGHVLVEAAADRPDKLDADTIGLADVARLNDVTLRYYADAADAKAGPSAALFTLRVDNLVFDNNRFSLYTDDTTIDGKTVLADDVPVYVRGRQYDFDGRGLLIRWEAKTRKPTLFRVAHGRSLTMKDGRAFLPKPAAKSARATGLPTLLALLASRDDAGVADAVAAAAATRPAFDTYRATLEDNVLATQAGETLLRADAVESTFAAVPDVAGGDGKPATQAPKATDAKPRRAATTATSPSPAPADLSPITLAWDGPLLVTLVEGRTPLRDADDVRLRATGVPLVLRRDGSEARARQLDYDRGGDLLTLRADTGDAFSASDFDAPAPPPTAPADDAAGRVSLTDATGRTLVTRQLVARPDAGTATATGEGYAALTDDAGRPVRVRWDTACDFVTGDAAAGGARTLRSIHAVGAVNVRHPEFVLDAATLDLSLKPAGDSATLDALRAVGDVRVTPADAAKSGVGGLASDRLDVSLAGDDAVTLTATGHVRAEQPTGDLTANALVATLAKTPDGGFGDLRSLRATGDVRGKDGEGRSLSADVLTVTPGENGRHLRLEGDARTPASVGRGAQVVRGPVVEFDEASGDFAVPQPGRLDAEQARQDAPPLPVAVTWRGQLRGTREQVIADGGVNVSAGDAAQRLNLDAERAIVNLEPAPSTTKPAAGVGPIKSVSLAGGVRATVQERDGEAILRSFDLRAGSLTGTLRGGDDAAVVIDTPGQMLVRDLRPGDAADKGSFRGNVAFGWKDKLDWSPGTDGGVLTLTGDAKAAVEPAGRPTFTLAGDAMRLVTTRRDKQRELTGASADGAVRFATKGLGFTAARVDYDPLAKTVSARGTPGDPVVVYNDAGVPTGRFATLVYNIETAQIVRVTNAAGG